MFTPLCVTEKCCKDPSEKNAATNLRKINFSPCISWIQHSTGRAGVNGKKTPNHPQNSLTSSRNKILQVVLSHFIHFQDKKWCFVIDKNRYFLCQDRTHAFQTALGLRRLWVWAGFLSALCPPTLQVGSTVLIFIRMLHQCSIRALLRALMGHLPQSTSKRLTSMLLAEERQTDSPRAHSDLQEQSS